ncbi:MAG TPA: hypothetical protein VK338_03695, partial [Candidatus Nitrosocosmicus sp.]|nr:hypothetical protein [Candidatus Nitrosocosmicus sp.]
YSDIIKWFKSPGNGTSAEELTIRLPYETLFTAHQKRFRSSDPDILETFKGQFWRNDLEQASFTQEEAIFNFRR